MVPRQQLSRDYNSLMSSEHSTDRVLSAASLRTSGAILAAHIALARLIDSEAVAPLGLDSTLVDLLVRLDQAPSHRLRAVQLSRQLLLSPSHISRMIDRAETSGLVERCPDPNDRRASQIVLTPAGRNVVYQFAPLLEAIIDRVIGQTLSAQEADTLVDLLGRIEATASEPGGRDSI